MHEQELRARLEQVRKRWLRAEGALMLAKALATSALFVSATWALSLVFPLSGGQLVALTVLTALGCGVAIAWAVWPLRTALPPERLARFIEEKCPELEDRVASAVQVLEHPGPSPFEALVVRDAARRLDVIDLDAIVDGAVIRKRTLLCAAAGLSLVVALGVARHTVSFAARTAWYALFPPTLTLAVEPGDARVRSGEPLAVTATLTGAAADLDWGGARLAIGHGDAQRTVEATAVEGRFQWQLPDVDRSFEYQVSAAGLSSQWFRVDALSPARVTRIDVSYRYPAFSGLGPRTEEDTGDIYGPRGTAVTLSITTDKPVDTATLALAGGVQVALTKDRGDRLRGELEVSGDSAYRVALVDVDGLDNPGDTEYFIRVMDDAPPDVKVSRPGGDRQVTRLEEVAIEARADDDYGVDQLELVYTVSGQTEKVVPLHAGAPSTTVTGHDVLYVEDLDVKPGDFVTYYARARDVGRGKAPTIAQSDIFFLDVRPFSEQFVKAQSQAGGGGMSGGQLEELVTAQKDIIVATWKVERRAAAGRSADDVRAIQRAQDEVRKKAVQAAGDAEGGRRAPRRRPGTPPNQPPEPDDLVDPLQRAVESMGKAAEALGAIKTKEALPHEMDALNRLLEAQAENTRRQVTQQNGGGGAGQQGQQQDLSALFDRELLRQTETNYETEKSASSQDDSTSNDDDTLSKLKELARRQDELARQQQDLAERQDDLGREELKRQLEKLTREQAELRQQAERLAEQMTREAQRASASRQGRREDQGNDPADASEPSLGQQQSGQQGGQPSGQQPRSGQQAGRQNDGAPGGSQQLREASEQMRSATSELRRSELEQAAERSQRAVEQLRELERQLRALQPEEQRRQLGELELEARELAESQRRLADAGQAGRGSRSSDDRRRLAGEQAALADRAEQLEQAMSAASAPDAAGRAALGDAARELDERRVPERMRQASELLSRGSSASTGGQLGAAEPEPVGAERRTDAGPQVGATAGDVRQEQQDLASALDRIADKMNAALGRDAQSRELSEKLAELRGLRERLSEIEQRMAEAGRRAEQPAQGQKSQSSNSDSSSGSESGQAVPASGSGGQEGSSELERLRTDYARELRQAETVMEELRQGNPALGGQLASLEQHYNSRSAPGTEAFKQDFARWDVLRRDVQLALERLEGSLANQLSERDSRQRVNVGGDDPLPESYRKQISDYYRSLAKRPGGSS